jgi:hypothetical protein
LNDAVFVIQPGSYRLATIRIGDDDRIYCSLHACYVLSHDLFERYFFNRAIGISDLDILAYDFYLGDRSPRIPTITLWTLKSPISGITLRSLGPRRTFDLHIPRGIDLRYRNFDRVRRAM